MKPAARPLWQQAGAELNSIGLGLDFTQSSRVGFETSYGLFEDLCYYYRRHSQR